jgi:hypothetical protein
LDLYTLLKCRIFWAFSIALLVATASFAQSTPTTVEDGGPDPSLVRVRIGSLWMNPTVAIPNIGVDTNVFNDPLNVTPKKDFVATIVPKADMWLRLGRTWLTGTIAEEVVWFQQYESERSVNSTYSVGWKAPLNRLVLSTKATRLSTNSRPGFEIDTRAQRTEPLFEGSVEVRGFPRTFIGARATWNQVRFADDAMYQGESLKDQLDRTITSAAITIRHELTPLTSLTFSGGRTEQLFEFEPLRNSSSSDYTVGLVFDPAALIKGGLTVGYKIFTPEADDLDDYRGPTIAAGLTYTLLGSTRIAGDVARDVDFSYDVNQPYYVHTGGTISIAQQIFGPVDATLRFGVQRLDYQARNDVLVQEPNRVDHVRLFGFGFGLHLGQELRIGFNVEKDRRRSPLPEREYDGLRYGSSVTYGL